MGMESRTLATPVGWLLERGIDLKELLASKVFRWYCMLDKLNSS